MICQPIYDSKYEKLNPRLDLIKKQNTYEPNDYNYLNELVINKLPTEEELEKAKIYENKVPKYIISNGDKNFPNSVIINKRIYYNYDRDLTKLISYLRNKEAKQINTIEQTPTK